MEPRVQISRHYVDDPRHREFVRNTGLHYGTFADRGERIYQMGERIVVALAVVALVAIALGLLT